MRRGKTARALKPLEFPGGALTKGMDSATGMRTGGAIPCPAYTPLGTIETPRGLMVWGANAGLRPFFV